MSRARDRHIPLRDVGCFVAVIEIHGNNHSRKYWGRVGLVKVNPWRPARAKRQSSATIRPRYIVERIVTDNGGVPLRMQDKYIVQLSKIGQRVHDAVYDLRAELPKIGARVCLEGC